MRSTLSDMNLVLEELRRTVVLRFGVEKSPERSSVSARNNLRITRDLSAEEPSLWYLMRVGLLGAVGTFSHVLFSL